MSIFTNPASRSIADARAYTDAIVDLLGSQEPLQVLGHTPTDLRAAVASLPDAQLRRPEAEGKWSIAQVVQHLADSDLVWSYRMRMVMAQERPPLTGYDQDLWAERLRYNDADVEEALTQFEVLRRANLRLLANASEADLQRVGIHAERGEESLAHMIRLYAGHDLLHLRQIDRIRRAIAS